jgi:ribosome-associated toxin RatA of RatAB toxin-antitoxin module
MPISETTIETFVSPAEFLDVVLDVTKYPAFLPEVKEVEVISSSDTAMRARFGVAVAFAGLDVKTEYTVDYVIDRDALTVTWSLHASPDLTVNDGEWRLKETDDGETKAHYRSEIVTSLPIAPEIQKAFADSQLPELMQKFQDRAESL